MILEKLWIPMSLIQSKNNIRGTRPDKNLMLRICKMVGQTTSKVACAEDEHLGLGTKVEFGDGHFVMKRVIPRSRR